MKIIKIDELCAIENPTPGEPYRPEIKRKGLSGVSALLSSWHEPIVGGKIDAVMDEGRRYIERIDALVGQIHDADPLLSSEELSLRALERLGIPVPRVLFMVEASFRGHLERPLGGRPSGRRKP